MSSSEGKYDGLDVVGIFFCVLVLIPLFLIEICRKKKKKLYIAGKWFDRQRLGEIIDLFAKSDEYQITHDWTKEEVPSVRTRKINQRFAFLDLEGVRQADLVIADLTDPEYMYRGTWTEIGCALSRRKPVITVGPRPKGPIFYDASNVKHVDSWVDLIDLAFEGEERTNVLEEYMKIAEKYSSQDPKKDS